MAKKSAVEKNNKRKALAERFAAAPLPPENPTPVEAMDYRLKTADGKKL